jgi:hypothetical protein
LDATQQINRTDGDGANRKRRDDLARVHALRVLIWEELADEARHGSVEGLRSRRVVIALHVRECVCVYVCALCVCALCVCARARARL